MRTRYIVEVVPFEHYRVPELFRFERRSDAVVTSLMWHPNDKVTLHRVDKIDRRLGTIETTELVS